MPPPSRPAHLTGWRIVKRRHAARAMDGEGARLHGGRWNSPGVPVVYLAESRSLAVLEILVHLQESTFLGSWVLLRARFEARDVAVLERSHLPEDWRASPPPAALARIGDAWVVARESLVLEVPSVIVPEERLWVVNPRHPRAASLVVADPEPIAIDPRLR